MIRSSIPQLVRQTLLVFCEIALIQIPALAAHAMPSAPPGVNYSYTLIGSRCTHDYYLSQTNGLAEGRLAAQALSQQLGVPAYLATIGSYEEQAWLDSKDLGICWIGLTELAEGQWVWDNGEPYHFAFWCGGEPNNQNGVENACLFGWGEVLFGAEACWNDVMCCGVPQWNSIIEVERNLSQPCPSISFNYIRFGPEYWGHLSVTICSPNGTKRAVGLTSKNNSAIGFSDVNAEGPNDFESRVTFPLTLQQFNQVTSYARTTEEADILALPLYNVASTGLLSTNCAAYAMHYAEMLGLGISQYARTAIGSYDPTVFGAKLDEIGNGNCLEGGIVELWQPPPPPLVGGAALSPGSLSGPWDFALTPLASALQVLPDSVAEDYGVSFLEVMHSATTCGPGSTITLNITGPERTNVFASLSWGGALAAPADTVTFTHVAPISSFSDQTARLVLFGRGYVQRHTFPITVVPGGPVLVLNARAAAADSAMIRANGPFPAPDWDPLVAGVEDSDSNRRSGSPIFRITRSAIRNEFAIEVDSERTAIVTLDIYDVFGRRVRSWRIEPGMNRGIRWDGTGVTGRLLPSGVYLVRGEALGNSRTQKVLLIR